MRLRAAIVIGVIAVSAVAGCGDSGSGGASLSTGLPPAGGGGTLAYALPALPSTLDPLAAKSRAEQTVTRQLYEPLIERLAGPYAQAAPQAGPAPGGRAPSRRKKWTGTPPA